MSISFTKSKGYKNMNNENKLSNVLKDIMILANVEQKNAAKVLNKPLGSFRNKLYLDRFSIHEVMMIAEICGYHLALVPEDENMNIKLLLGDDYLNDDEIESVKNYKKSMHQYQLNLLQGLMNGMTTEEKKNFSKKNFDL